MTDVNMAQMTVCVCSACVCVCVWGGGGGVIAKQNIKCGSIIHHDASIILTYKMLFNSINCDKNCSIKINQVTFHSQSVNP